MNDERNPTTDAFLIQINQIANDRDSYREDALNANDKLADLRAAHERLQRSIIRHLKETHLTDVPSGATAAHISAILDELDPTDVSRCVRTLASVHSRLYDLCADIRDLRDGTTNPPELG